MCCENELKNPDNWRLYHLLELEQPVTAKQVQWTFRKVTLRHHFYQAYLVLSDSDRKSLYDALGEDAVGFIHSGSWGPLIYLIGAKGSVVFYCLSMIVVFAMMLLFFLLLGLRVDDHITWPWVRVVAPLFVVALLSSLVTAIALIVSLFWRPPWEEGMRCVERLPAVGNFIAAVCYTIFCFLVASSVEVDSTNSSREFSGYFALPIVADVIYYLVSLVWRLPRRVRLQMEVGLNKPSWLLSNGFFVMGFLNIGVSIAQWVVLGHRIDRRITVSWYIAFIPFCFRAALRILEAFMRSMVKRTIGVKTAMGVAFDTLGAFFFNGMLLVSLYFVAVRISRGKHEVRMPLALIPVYVALVYLLLAMIFTIIYLLRKNIKSEREERLNNLKWIPTELPTEDQSGPMLFRDFPDDNAEADWNAIPDDDDDSSMVFPAGNESDGDSDDYDDFDSAAEEEVFNDAAESHASNTPYGVSAPPDEDARPYAGSRTPTNTSTTGSVPTGRPPSRTAHHDPNDPKTDVARFGGARSDDYDDEEEDVEEEYEDEDDYDADDRIGTVMSSSASSTVFFTPSIRSRH